jgi:hypothetical protein
MVRRETRRAEAAESDGVTKCEGRGCGENRSKNSKFTDIFHESLLKWPLGAAGLT